MFDYHCIPDSIDSIQGIPRWLLSTITAAHPRRYKSTVNTVQHAVHLKGENKHFLPRKVKWADPCHEN